MLYNSLTGFPLNYTEEYTYSCLLDYVKTIIKLVLLYSLLLLNESQKLTVLDREGANFILCN